MEIVLTLLAGALLTALGARLIHRLNAQHDARIAAHRFSAPYPSLSRPPGHGNPGAARARRRPPSYGHLALTAPGPSPSSRTEHAVLRPTKNDPLPQAGHAEIRIVSATPEAARAVAEVIRRCFAGSEQRSYPAPGGGTRLHLTVDTETAAGPADRTWLSTSRPPAGTGPHAEEP